MTALLEPGVRYRTPAVFGPAPGPRQRADGTPWPIDETGTMRAEWFAVRHLTRRDALEALLPPGFAIRGEPVVAVSVSYFHDLYWLAGRGYGIVRIEFPVTYRGRDETIDGTFSPVMWEGHPDAILTGRDELGFPKLFADIDELDLDLESGRVAGSASWLGHTFVTASASELVEVDPGGPMPGADGPTLQFKYVPSVGPDGTIGADVAYVTTSSPLPGSAGAADAIDTSRTRLRRWRGSGEVAWHRASFAQLPTSFHVVNGMADLPILDVVDAELVVFSAPGATVAASAVRAVVPAEAE